MKKERILREGDFNEKLIAVVGVEAPLDWLHLAVVTAEHSDAFLFIFVVTSSVASLRRKLSASLEQ